MPATASRAVLRQSQFLTRRTAVRYASSTSESAQKAGEAASSAASKASEGLSRVTSTAGPALSNAAQGVGSALRKVGGRTGKVIAFVDSMIPPTLYYSKVGLELAKLVFRGQNMTPPNLATFQSFYQPLLNAFRSPAALKNANFVSPGDIAARVRNANKKEIALAGVTLAEIIGFFTVGEMIGRMNIVGYRGHPEHHGDH
ncbi:mitochondrial ATP synthase g subunit-domain-containing protein [Aspergillus tamarii]|uniref:Mitochondrial ATP synthase g subunit-domain-containing protein n=1 Tax=Aspergillus tamarii TaxID=41984 RepID=A0A5N6UYY3_ASPTM|nr:mitochondrial ATP synthase g subunit-domain-containing protein [Aspergillus tamarii]